MKPIIALNGSARQTRGTAPRTYGPAKRHGLITMAALATVLTANLASAAPADSEPRQAVVHYSDLDLSSAKDARRLYSRIRIAARMVCENFRSPDFQRVRVYRECMDKAVTEAVAKVQSAQVAAIAGADTQHLSKR